MSNPPPIDRARLAAYYEARAPSYDDEEPLDRDLARTLVEWARPGILATGRPALDCGCGTGRVAAALVGAGLPCVGIDLVPAMIARAREKALAAPAEATRPSWFSGIERTGAPAEVPAGAPRMQLALADAAALPLRAGSIGAVLDVAAWHDYADPADVLREWTRVLDPRGTLVFADFVEKDTDDAGFLSALERLARPGAFGRYWKGSEVRAALENAGLAVESVAIFRTRVGFERFRAAPGGAALIAGASAAVRELYQMDAEGMTWRLLTLFSRKRR